MMYDKSDGGRNYRMHCGVQLGWWHTYKHVALKIWTTFAKTIWAPLFHHLYPGETFYPSNKNFTHVLALFQCCMVAFRDVYKEIREAADDVSIRASSRMAFKELLFVMDYALPVVVLRVSNSVCVFWI